MNPNWDLSYLYKGFDDPAFLADLKRFPEEIKVEQAILDGGDDPQTKLEKLTDQQEILGALADRLSSFCSLTQAVDANNADATKYLNVLDVIFNDSRIVSSAITRYIGGLANLEDLIAASPKLQKVAFHLRESAENAHHTIPEAVEPWILEMSLSGGSAFSQLRDKLDSTHTANYRGQEIPLSAVRGLAYDANASVRKDAYEAEIASYKKMELPMSYCLNAVKMEARTLSKAKGYPSVLDMTLSDSRMDRATLDAMLTAIREYLPHFRRYMKAKAKLLGHQNGLPFYDLFAPVGQNVHTYTVEEARENAADLPWEADVTFLQCDIAEYEAEPFDLIVSNPPFFSSGISDPDTPRLLARHDGALSPLSLPGHAARLLLPGGRLAMIFPYERLEEVEEVAAKAGLAPIRITTVRGHSSAPVKRVLTEFMKPADNDPIPPSLCHELTLETSPGVPSEEYRRLGHPFYLYF